MTIPNVDDLFSKIDDIAESMEKAKKEGGKKGSGGGKKTTFKNLDMTFLGGVRGSYELKVFIDGTGALSEEIFLHSVQVGKEKKVTIPCAGDECEICKRQKRLEDLKNKAAWKFRRYKLHKILVKIGDIPEGGSGIQAGGIYVAYVDDKFFKPLIDTIRTNKKYYKDDIAKMLTPSERSGGFLVSAAKTGKSVTFNFNFIPSIGIDPVDIQEVFGSDQYKVANYGYFRNNFMPEEKYKRAISMLDSLLIATADNSKGAAPAEEVKTESTEPTTQAAEQDIDQRVEEQKVDAPSPEQKSESTSEIPVQNVDSTPSDVRDPNVLGENGKPKCFSNFDPSSKVCTEQCQSKRDCLMEAMTNGTI